MSKLSLRQIILLFASEQFNGLYELVFTSEPVRLADVFNDAAIV